MERDKVMKYYGGDKAAVAEALGITWQAVHKWPDPIPMKSALRLQAITRGKLRVKLDLYRDVQ